MRFMVDLRSYVVVGAPVPLLIQMQWASACNMPPRKRTDCRAGLPSKPLKLAGAVIGVIDVEVGRF
jgi:hypothetical protein